MRSVMGIVSLVVVLGIVGILAKKQLGATVGAGNSGTTDGATQQQQSQQIQQQIKATVEGVMQQPRPMPDDK